MAFRAEVDDDTIDYLQRLGYEVDSYRSIVDYLFTTHMDDPDFLGSPLLKAYMKDYEKVNAEYIRAKTEYGEKVLRPMADERFGQPGVFFTWSIPDFAAKTVEVRAR